MLKQAVRNNGRIEIVDTIPEHRYGEIIKFLYNRAGHRKPTTIAGPAWFSELELSCLFVRGVEFDLKFVGFEPHIADRKPIEFLCV